MSWSPPELFDTNGILREYSVIAEEVQSGELNSYTTFATLINITGLKPYTQYSCRVAAVTVDMGPFSASINITTLQDGRKLANDTPCMEYSVILYCI